MHIFKRESLAPTNGMEVRTRLRNITLAVATTLALAGCVSGGDTEASGLPVGARPNADAPDIPGDGGPEAIEDCVRNQEANPSMDAAASAVYVAMHDEFERAQTFLDQVDDPDIRDEAWKGVQVARAEQAAWAAEDYRNQGLNRFNVVEALLKDITDPDIRDDGEDAVDYAEAAYAVKLAGDGKTESTNDLLELVEDTEIREDADRVAESALLAHRLRINDQAGTLDYEIASGERVSGWYGFHADAIDSWIELDEAARGVWFDFYRQGSDYCVAE